MPTVVPAENDFIVQALIQVGDTMAMVMETAEEAGLQSDSDTLTAGAEESSSDGSTPSESILSIEAPEASSIFT